MKITFRSLFKDMITYGAGDLLLKATAFITMPIYTRIFAPSDYGVWNNILTATALLGSILALGSDAVYARFFVEGETLQDRQMITSTWFGFLTAWSGAVVLVCLPFAGSFSRLLFTTEQYRILLMLALLTQPLWLVNAMCAQALRNRFRARLFTALNVATTLMSIGFSVLGVIVVKLGLTGVFLGPLLANLVILPVRLWTTRDLLRPVFSIRLLRDLVVFGIPVVPASLAYWVFGVSDRILLGRLSTLEQAGLYAVAHGLANVLVLVNSAFGQAWLPYAMRIHREQPQAATAFYGQAMTYILAGFGLLCVGVTAFAREALAILSTSAYYPAAIAIGPLALGVVAFSSTQVTYLGMMLTKKSQYFVLTWMAALFSIILNVIFIPRWGMLAAAWTSALSYLILTLAYLIISQRLCPVTYEKRKALTAIILVLSFTLLASQLPNPGLVAGLALKIAYCLAYLAALFAFRVLDQREWIMIRRALRGVF